MSVHWGEAVVQSDAVGGPSLTPSRHAASPSFNHLIIGALDTAEGKRVISVERLTDKGENGGQITIASIWTASAPQLFVFAHDPEGYAGS